MERIETKESIASFAGTNKSLQGLKKLFTPGFTPGDSGSQKHYFQPLLAQTTSPADFETFEPRDDLTTSQLSQNSNNLIQKQYDRELHLLLDDLDLPNQSLTVSQVSSLQGKSIRSYQSKSVNGQSESSQVQSARQSNLASLPSGRNTDEKTEKQHHEDSPDFNRRQDLVSVTDELTVSNTDLYGSKRGMYDLKNFDQVLRNQNRTFADSVLDHQINPVANYKTKTANKKNAAIARIDIKQYQNEGTSSREFLVSADSRRNPDELASSGLTDFDILTRTQISNNLNAVDPNARSRIIVPSDDISHLSHSQFTGDQPLTRRTNNTNNYLLRKMADDASSLNFTPDQLEDELQSISTSQQNSNGHSRTNSITQLKNLVKDQDQYDSGGKSNPINQLKLKIMQQNLQRKRSKGDLELEQALETPPVRQSSRHISELQQQNQELQQQLSQLTSKCDQYQRQLSELSKTGGSELLKARALEAARQEIRDLRDQCQEQEDQIRKMSDGHRQYERENQSHQDQIKALEIQLEKSKLIIQGLKRDNESQSKQFQQTSNQQNLELDNFKQSCDYKVQQAQQQQKMMEQRLRQCEEFLSMRDAEVQEIQNELNIKNNEMTKLESHCYSLQQEIKNYKSKCTDLEQIVENKNVQPMQASSFDQELKRISDSYQQQMSRLKEDNQSLRSKIQSCSTMPQLAAILNVPQPLILETVNQLLENRNLQFEDIAQSKRQHQLEIQQLQSQLLQLKQDLQNFRLQKAHCTQPPESSMFTKNLIYQKDIEIQNQRDQINQLQEQNWQLEQDVKVMQMQAVNLNQVKQEMEKEIGHLKSLKERADQNVCDIRDKLRAKIEEQNLQFSSLRSSVAESVDRQKYEELITLVLSVDIVDDPLNGLALHESYVDEYEQAQKHLQEQSKLAKQKIQSQAQIVAKIQKQTEQQSEQIQKLQKDNSKLVNKMNELHAEYLSVEQSCKIQANLVQELESQLTTPFVDILDQVIKGDYSYSDRRLVEEIRRLLQNCKFGTSQIPNIPIHKEECDKSGILLLEELSTQCVNQQCQTDFDWNKIEHAQKTLILREQKLIEATQIIEELQDANQQLIEDQTRINDVQNVQSQLDIANSELQAQIVQLQKTIVTKQTEIDQLQGNTNQKLEIKKLNSEIQQIIKRHQDKENNLKLEFQKQKSALENQQLDHIQDIQQQHKKERKEAVDKAVDKIKVEMLNKMTELKNDQAKKESDWQRERNQFNKIKEQAIENALQSFEVQKADEIKEAKQLVERIWKRKLEDKQKTMDDSLKDLEAEITQLSVQNQSQVQKHKQEIDKLKAEMAKQKLELARDMPRQVDSQVQVSQNLKIETSPVSSRVLQASPDQTSMNVTRVEELEQFIDQLKIQFEAELERQDQLLRSERQTVKTAAFKSFESAVSLECDKILETINHKSKPLNDLNVRRQGINELIKDIIVKNDNSEKQLKRSYDAVKLKITTVLAQLKISITQKQENAAKQLNSARTSSEVNITLNSVNKSDTRIKQYTEVVQEDEELVLMNKLQPQTVNSKGQVVVEVDRVLRDLTMVYETVCMSKFCKILGCGQIPSKSQDFDKTKVVERYRDVQNDFFKLINRLNQASDKMGQEQETIRLRLANVDLKQQLQQYKHEQSQIMIRQLVPVVLAKYQNGNPCVTKLLQMLEQLHFQISKDQFKLNQITDLFIKNGRVNEDSHEVNTKCKNFQHEQDSSFKQKYLSPEMLSPDETASLIANVLQKLPNQNLTNSSEEILSKALKICHDQSVMSMPPLQRPPKAQQISRTITTSDISKRSRSTGMQPGLALYNMPQQTAGTSIYQTLLPQTLSQGENTSVQARVNDRYTNYSQGQKNTLSTGTDFLIEDGEESILIHKNFEDELLSAQTNVNQLFQKLKGNRFNTLQN